MEREVDRLLAGLSGADSRARHNHTQAAGSRNPVAVERRRASAPRRRTDVPTRGDLIGLWARLLLGVVLGGAMTQWPYPRACGEPLLAYVGAIGMLTLAGIWIAACSWRLRIGLVHVLALMLLFSGIFLAAGQVLPRVGYAAEHAAWRC